MENRWPRHNGMADGNWENLADTRLPPIPCQALVARLMEPQLRQGEPPWERGLPARDCEQIPSASGSYHPWRLARQARIDMPCRALKRFLSALALRKPQRAWMAPIEWLVCTSMRSASASFVSVMSRPTVVF